MARTDIPVNEIVRAGIADWEVTPVMADYANGMQFDNNGKIWVEITNNSGADQDVTFPSPLVTDGLAVADFVVTVTDNTIARHGPILTTTYNQEGNVVYVDLDTTGLEFAAYKLSTATL